MNIVDKAHLKIIGIIREQLDVVCSFTSES